MAGSPQERSGQEPATAGNCAAIEGWPVVHTGVDWCLCTFAVMLYICQIVHTRPTLLCTGLVTLPWQPPLYCSHDKHQYSCNVVKICWVLVDVRYTVFNYG